MQPEPEPAPGPGVGVGVGVGIGVHRGPPGVGAGTREGCGDPGSGVLGGANVGVGAGGSDGAGEALAPVNWVQVVPSQAQSSSDTCRAGARDAGFVGLKVVADSPPNSSSFPDTPS